MNLINSIEAVVKAAGVLIPTLFREKITDIFREHKDEVCSQGTID